MPDVLGYETPRLKGYPWGVYVGATHSSSIVRHPSQPFTAFSAWRRHIPSALSEVVSVLRLEENTPSLVAEVDSLLEQLQELGIRFGTQYAGIRSYLLRFPDMIEVVAQVVYTAREHLPEAQLWMEVYRDPENEDEHLVLYARFHQYDERTMERIRSVRKEYRPLLVGKSGWLILTTDFQQPE